MSLFVRFFILAIFFSPLLSSGEENGQDLLADTCKTIQFSKANGSYVGINNLFHCHIITRQSGPKVTDDILSLNEQYVGLICHDHELDGGRNFHKGLDNVNIFVSKGGKARFMGVKRTAVASDVNDKYPWLTQDKSFPKMTNQINFFKLGDSECGKFKKYKTFKCGDQDFCFGSASVFDQRSTVDGNSNSSAPASP